MSPRLAATAAESLRQRLVELVGDRVERSDPVRAAHGRGEGLHAEGIPDLVVYPESTAEVSAVARRCFAAGAPMVPFGAGTSFEGQVSALEGGVSIDLTRMNRILRVSVDDLDATVEAGVTRGQLTHGLRSTGATFFIDPGANATIGGMIATGASGTTTVRYGTMRDNVLGLTVVLADGQIIHTGGRARKSSAGYDLTRLFAGSAGTLGIITEAILRLHPIPAAIGAARCAFGDVRGAVRTVSEAVLIGVPLARSELVDAVAMQSFNAYAGTAFPELATVFFEFHGLSSTAIREQADAVAEIAAKHGGGKFEWATNVSERERIWETRHKAFFAGLASRPGARGWPTDVCVPISRLAECIEAAQTDVERSSIHAPLVGHIGDGNFHLLYLVDPSDANEMDVARVLHARLVARALAVGGTCTGEHGVGCGKLEALASEHFDSMDTMRAIKRSLDPKWLMNPGKILPTDSQVVR